MEVPVIEFTTPSGETARAAMIDDELWVTAKSILTSSADVAMIMARGEAFVSMDDRLFVKFSKLKQMYPDNPGLLEDEAAILRMIAEAQQTPLERANTIMSAAAMCCVCDGEVNEPGDDSTICMDCTLDALASMSGEEREAWDAAQQEKEAPYDGTEKF